MPDTTGRQSASRPVQHFESKNKLPKGDSNAAKKLALHAHYRASAHLFANHADSRSRGGSRPKCHNGFRLIAPPTIWSDAIKQVVRDPNRPQYSPAQIRALHHGGSI